MPAKPLEAHVERQLSIVDIASPPPTERPELKKLKSRHRLLARLLAGGLSQREAASVAGYTPANVSLLQRTDAFADLVKFYQREVDREFIDTQQRLAGLADDAVEELLDRLEHNPEALSTREVLEIAALAADRSGNGPQTSNTQINVVAGLGDRMRAGLMRAQQARDVTARPAPLPALEADL